MRFSGWVLNHGDDVRLEICEGTYAGADGRARLRWRPGIQPVNAINVGQMSFDSSHATLLRCKHSE